MSLSFAIRKAYSPAICRSIRAIGSSRSAFDAAIMSASLDVKPPLTTSLQPRTYSSAPKKSVAKNLVDENLIRLIDAEIINLNPVKDIPKGFPFTVENNVEEETLLLTREFHSPNETIKVEIQLSSLENANNEVCNSDDPSDDDDDDDDDDNVGESTDHEDNHNVNDDGDDNGRTELGFPMVAKVFKPNKCLEFEVTLTSDDISIQSLKIKELDNSAEDNEEPSFLHISETLQHGLDRYLEIRGIGPVLANFLSKYKVNRDNQEQMERLKKLKIFVNN